MFDAMSCSLPFHTLTIIKSKVSIRPARVWRVEQSHSTQLLVQHISSKSRLQKERDPAWYQSVIDLNKPRNTPERHWFDPNNRYSSLEIRLFVVRMQHCPRPRSIWFRWGGRMINSEKATYPWVSNVLSIDSMRLEIFSYLIEKRIVSPNEREEKESSLHPFRFCMEIVLAVPESL